VLLSQIDDAPPTVALLDVSESERSYLRAAETAAEENGENASFAQSLHRSDIGRAQESLRLPQR
jgi:hypothetical protein